MSEPELTLERVEGLLTAAQDCANHCDHGNDCGTYRGGCVDVEDIERLALLARALLRRMESPRRRRGRGVTDERFRANRDLKPLSIDELDELQEQAQQELDRIKDQLAHCEEHADDVERGLDWYLRADSARRHFGRLLQRIQTERGRKRRLIGQQAHCSRGECFIQAARDRLDGDTFQELMADARAIAEQRKAAATQEMT